MSRAGRLAAYAVALDIAHDVADHVVQTDDQADRKAHREPLAAAGAMMGHLAGQAVCQGAAVALISTLTGRPSSARVAGALALSVGTHGFLDRRWPVLELLRRTGSERFATPRVVVSGSSRPGHLRGSDPVVHATGKLPLHGTYLADQALHRVFVLAAAVILSG